MYENELIAEFMGVHKLYEAQSSNQFNQYHTDWNALMNVAKRCRLESRCEYDTDDAWDKIHWALEECNKHDTYDAVVEFIKQYNKENHE